MRAAQGRAGQLVVTDFDGAALTVSGKRNKTRVVPVANGALDTIADWLYMRSTAPGPLFVRIFKGDYMTTEGITAQAVYNVCVERAA